MKTTDVAKQGWIDQPISWRLWEASNQVPVLIKDAPKQYGLKFPNLSHDQVTEIVSPILRDCGIYYSGEVVGEVDSERHTYSAWNNKANKVVEQVLFVATGLVKVSFFAIGMEDKHDQMYKHSVTVSSAGSDNAQPMFAHGAMISYGVKYCLCEALAIVTGETEKDNRSDAHNFPTAKETQHRVDRKLDDAQPNGEVLEEVMGLPRALCFENDWVMNDVMKWIKKTCGKTLNQMDDDERKEVPPRVSREYKPHAD